MSFSEVRKDYARIKKSMDPIESKLKDIEIDFLRVKVADLERRSPQQAFMSERQPATTQPLTFTQILRVASALEKQVSPLVRALGAIPKPVPQTSPLGRLVLAMTKASTAPRN